MDACPAQVRSLRIEARVAELRRMSAWLMAAARELGIAKGIASDFEVCANEAAANIISYGFEGAPADCDDHEIGFSLSTGGGFARLTISDGARPFNPLDVPARPLPAALEEAPIGGLGIPLIRALCDECRYVRIEGRNQLEMRISLSRALT